MVNSKMVSDKDQDNLIIPMETIIMANGTTGLKNGKGIYYFKNND